MNKYQEALNKITKFSALYEDEYEGGSEKTQRNEKIIQELVNKEIELQSRKDKLVVGSEWVCETQNFPTFSNFSIRKGEIVTVRNIGMVAFEDSKGFVHEMYEDQFLLCFKPR